MYSCNRWLNKQKVLTFGLRTCCQSTTLQYIYTLQRCLHVKIRLLIQGSIVIHVKKFSFEKHGNIKLTMSSGLSQLRLRDFKLQTGVVTFDRCGCSPGKGRLMKGTVKMHHGNCRIRYLYNVTDSRDWKSGHLDYCCSSLIHFFSCLL